MNGTADSGSNIPPGVVFTSSKAIKALCPREFSERTIRRSLSHLEEIGWIKRWRKPGNRGNYPILIARASVHTLSGTEYRVNADATSDWRNPVLVPATECPGSVHEVSTDREVENREGRKNRKTAKPTPSADPRFRPFFSFAYDSYQTKHQNHKPTWRGKDTQQLQALLKATAEPIEELRRRWTNYLSSSEGFTAKQGDSLAYFCAHFDSFINGPIRGGKEKLSGEDAIRRSIGNSGLDEDGNYKRPN